MKVKLGLGLAPGFHDVKKCKTNQKTSHTLGKILTLQKLC